MSGRTADQRQQTAPSMASQSTAVYNPGGRGTQAEPVPNGQQQVQYAGQVAPATNAPPGMALNPAFDEYRKEVAENQAPPPQQPWAPEYNPSTANFAQPNFQPYTPPQGNGMNMMQPGAGEQRYEDTKHEYDAPSAIEQFWSQSSSAFTTPTAGEQYAADVKNRYGTGPSVAKDGDYGAYYDRAKERAVESLDSSLAARGAYGSSVGLGQIGETIADLEADRARTEADYNLRALGEERAWVDTLSGIQSDAGRMGLERVATGGTMAGAADAGKMERLRAGQDAAGAAQDLQRRRAQDYFENNLKMGDRLSGLSTEYSNGLLSNDQALLDAIIALQIGQGTQSVANATYFGQQGRDDSERLNDTIMNVLAATQSQEKK